MLIPFLMQGAGLGDIVRAFGGVGQGAAGMDGLSSAISASMMNARRNFPLKQNQETINSAAEMLVDRLGINPYSGAGQGFSALLGGAYHAAPDIVGGILGIPNGQRFFSLIANGASGINLAAGYGSTDVLNPYSVMENHKRSMDMAKTVYDLGVKQDGGYDISYSHGLNMDEMGKVTQRLLSSRIAYREVSEGEDGIFRESGKDISFDKESDKFKENIKKLGSKFNEAASMLSKVTGSVEEAINMMDRLAGGNFLGGTAEQASKVASQAKRMATAIRVTSAIAGVSPTEAYENMTKLQSGMATGMGMSSYVANASGFSSLMGDMAFNATMGYNTWLAMNPNASPMQRKQALLAVNGRVQAYASSNAAALSAAIADNADMFSSDERKQIQDAMRSGHPEAVVGMVRGRIGESMYNTYMTDQSVQAAARYRASKDEKSSALLKDLDQANIEGNLQQVEDYGARLITRRTLSDIDDEMARRSGNTGFEKGRTEAVKRKFVDMAVKQGMRMDAAEKMDVDALRSWLQKRPGIEKSDLSKEENLAKIQEAGRQIDAMTMDDRQEESARQRLIKEIDNTSWNDEKKNELKKLAGRNGANLEEIANEAFSANTASERREIERRVFQGRFSRAGAATRKLRLERLEKAQDQNYTVDERMSAITRDSARQDLTEMGGLKKALLMEAPGNMRKAFDSFLEKARELEKRGAISLKGDEDLSKTYGNAASGMLADIFGDKLGSMEGDDLRKLERRLSEEIVNGMRGGSTFQEAFAASMKNLSDADKAKIGKDNVDRLVASANKGELKSADGKTSMVGKTFIDRASDELAKGASSEDVRKELSRAGDEIGKLGEGDVLDRFAEKARGLEGNGLLSLGEDKDLTKTYNEAARRMVSGIFGDKLGSMEGDDLRKLETRLSEEIVKGMRGGSTFQEAFADAIGKLTEEEKGKIGYGTDKDGKTLAGQATVDYLVKKARSGDLKDADRKAFLATTSSVIDERSKGVKADAIKEMAKLAKGDIGKLSEADAFKRFTELAKTVGGYDISDEEFDKLSAEKSKSVKEKGSAQKAISDMLGAMKPRGQKDLGFFAMSGTGSPDNAGILMAASMAKIAGLDLRKIDFGKGMEGLLSALDDEKSGRTMNAWSNAIHVGGASYQKESIKSAETQALRLGELVNKDKSLLEDAKAAYGTGPEADEAKKRLVGKLNAAGSADADSDAAMIATLQGKTIGGQNAMEVMQKGRGGLDAAKKAAGDKYDEQMIGVVRESARKDSEGYAIGKSIGDLISKISPFIDLVTNPNEMSPIPVKLFGPVDLSRRSVYP